MSISRALLSGAAGALSLTAVHQTARGLTNAAPRMDLLGMRALARAFRAADASPPPRGSLYGLTLAGDLVSNTLYYSLVDVGEEGGEWKRGVLLGLAAGAGTVVLPPLLGLGSAPSRRTPETAVMTVAWYTLGGLTAAGAARWLKR
jgi:hypothetical protein